MIDIIKFLDSHHVEYKGPNARGYIVLKECVFCGKSKKLNVSVIQDPVNSEIKPGFVKCYSCSSGGLHNLYAQIASVDIEVARGICYGKRNEEEIFVIDIQRPDLETFEADPLSKILLKYQTVTLPDFSVPISDKHIQAVEYLEKRGLTLDDAIKAQVHVLELTKRDEVEKRYIELGLTGEELLKKTNETSRFMGRVTFPVTFNGAIYGFVSRDYWGRDAAYKVLNSSGPLTSAFVWNYDLVKKSARLVINEGIFDALKCGVGQSMALLGKAANEESDRIKLIKKLNPEEIVIYLDNGAYDEAMHLAQILSKSFKNIKIVVTEPILNGSLSKEAVSLIEKLIPIEEENGVFRVLPRDFKLIKEFNRIISKSGSISEMYKIMNQRLKLPEYRNNKSSQRTVAGWCKRFAAAPRSVKNLMAQALSEISALGYVDAGDRCLEENQKLIESAIPFNPSFDLSLIA